MSDENQKYEIDELLSGYLDGELSKRQHTEVQRLIQHDEEIPARIDQMRRQKLLLGSMPVESAPENMMDDIKAAMERRLILNETPAAVSESEGRRHLYIRRMMTAAVIFVLLGSLTGIVVNIMAPSKNPQKTLAQKTDPRPAINVGDPATAKLSEFDFAANTGDSVFSAALAMTTKESIAMSNFVWKAIYNNGLRDDTFPQRDVSETTYLITADIDCIVALLSEMATVWDRCNTAALSIKTARDESNVVINNVTAQQAVSLFKEGVNEERFALARAYADLNTLTGHDRKMKLLELEAKDTHGNFVLPTPVKPEYTSGDDKLTDKKPAEDTEKVTLVITIKGI